MNELMPRTDQAMGSPIDILLVEDNPGDVRLTREALDDGGTTNQLHVVGDGPERPRIEAEIQRLGIKDRCTLLGKRAGKELVDEFHQADVFAMASFMEGLPVVLMEAMASSVAVVAPWIAGIPELVVHEQCGLLYAPARWDQLADAILRPSGLQATDKTAGVLPSPTI